MTYVPGFDYDIFLSYAHADDVAKGNSTEGWVTKLCTDLKSGVGELGARGFKVFIDYEGLGPNLGLTHQLMTTIDQSAIFMLILSPAYVASPWCGREKDSFLTSIDPESGRIFIVEKRPPVLFEGDPPCPPPLDELVGSRFWTGDPPRILDPFRKDDDEYVDKVNALSFDVVKQLKKMKLELAAESATDPAPTPPTKPAPDTTASVFLAEVTPDLDAARDLMSQYLAGFGVGCVPSSYYPERDTEEFTSKVTADLETSEVFVQLLGPVPDARARMQFECAQRAGKELFVWRDPELDLDRVRDPEYKELLTSEHVRAESLKDFEKTVKDRALAPPETESRPVTATAGGFCIFVHVDRSDLPLADVVMKAIAEHEGEGIELASADSERLSEKSAQELAEDFEDFLVDSDAVVIIRGQNDGWVQRQWLRLRRIMPKVMKRRGRNLTIAVYDGPPREREKIRITAPNLSVLNCRKSPEALDKFLEELSRTPA